MMSVLFYSFFMWVFVGVGGLMMVVGWSLLGSVSYVLEWSIFSDFSGMSLSWLVDGESLILSGVVLLVSISVLSFAKTYMLDESFNSRFLGLVVLFVLSMNLLVFIPNLVSMLLGWDGLGLVSYLLVIYYMNSSSLGAGMITVLSNRIGDGLILLGIGILLFGGSLNMMNMWVGSSESAGVVMMLFVVAGFTKSAQFPFCSWLPAAMAAPTPVSALVHSSTLVTAGVFLLIRLNGFLSGVEGFYFFMLFVSGVTMLLSGTAAIFENDMKKIIALSTLSQLSVMMGSIGLGAVDFALFHLMTHAMFKALMFICAGMVIYFLCHWQDLRVVGMTGMGFVFVGLVVSNFALCGFPFLAGFYSKDAILEFMLGGELGVLVVLMFIVGTVLTTSYSSRFLWNMSWKKFDRVGYYCVDSSGKGVVSLVGLYLLGVFSVFGGGFLNWCLLNNSLGGVLSGAVKMFPIMMMVGGLGVFGGLLVYNWGGFKAMWFFSSMWFLVGLSTQWCLSILRSVEYYSSVVDQGWQEIFGGQGAKMVGLEGSEMVVKLQDGGVMGHLGVGFVVVSVVVGAGW